MKKIILAVFTSFIFISTIFGQEPETNGDTGTLPKVFEIGMYEASYNQLVSEYNTLLLGACDDNMELAYGKWVSMLREMELFADQVSFDIKGGKFWLNVFFSPDGNIDYIGYSLKPISRPIEKEELESFLNAFTENFQFPIHISKRFVHYGSAAFPIMTIPVTIDEIGASDR